MSSAVLRKPLTVRARDLGTLVKYRVSTVFGESILTVVDVVDKAMRRRIVSLKDGVVGRGEDATMTKVTAGCLAESAPGGHRGA